MKAALVTGGAKRLGAAMVRALAADGWAVAIHYGRSADDAEACCAYTVNEAARCGSHLLFAELQRSYCSEGADVRACFEECVSTRVGVLRAAPGLEEAGGAVGLILLRGE